MTRAVNVGAVSHKPRLTSVLAGAALIAGLFAGGCGRPLTTAEPGDVAAAFAATLRNKVTPGAMTAHLQRLQSIADANDNTRAAGTPGFDASVDYLVTTLREHGFEVETPEFTARVFKAEKGSVSLADWTVEARALQFSAGTPPDGVSGPLVVTAAGEKPGCAGADYDGLPVRGAVVLVDRGGCPFKDKMTLAVERGAVAVVVADNVDEEKMGGTLGEQTAVKVPVVSVKKSEGATLRGERGIVTVKLDAHTDDLTSRNVVAQTRTGSTENVVMLGAHLDSVPEGPGINDNGSGVAAVLETALQLGPSPRVANAVRFGFWGAEELGLLGSMRYVQSLDVDSLTDVALYLNFDMLASPNPAYFTYDGDQSMPVADRGQPVVPEGSAGIERTLVAYLKSAGITGRDTSFDGRSDYDYFTLSGIPSGGLFSGAEEKKSPEQAKLWGGSADQPFDPNYHQAGDTIDNIDRTALAINGAGVGYVTGWYAQYLGGRNGIPVRADRTRNVVQRP